MICTNTHHYVNNLSTIKKKKEKNVSSAVTDSIEFAQVSIDPKLVII